MTGTVMSVPMPTKRPETTPPHTEHLKTFSHSGLRTTLWMVPTSKFQDKTETNQLETALITLLLLMIFILTNSPTEINLTIKNLKKKMTWRMLSSTFKVTPTEDMDLLSQQHTCKTTTLSLDLTSKFQEWTVHKDSETPQITSNLNQPLYEHYETYSFLFK